MEKTSENIFELNKKFWNQRTPVHLESDFYDMPRFLAGNSSLNSIEMPLLGDLKGKKVLHLQCHFGQDTLSMARMGAKCTGVDLSNAAVDKAKALNSELGLDASFVCCNVLELDQHLADFGSFDMFDDAVQNLKYSYFNRGVLLEESEGSYTENSNHLKQKSAYFNHGLSETISPLMERNFTLMQLQEFDWSPYPIFEKNEKYSKGYAPEGKAGIMPLVFAVEMQK